MRRPTARGLLGAAAAVVAFAAATLPPRDTADRAALVRAETWISAACGGTESCARWSAIRRVASHLRARMPEVPDEERMRLAAAIAEEAEEAEVDPLFVLAVIQVESGFDLDAVSERGAQGLMQLKPSTLRGEAERSQLDLDDPDDPVTNVRAGIRYYRRLLDAFRQNQELALMAYNAGPQRISRLLREEGGVPDRYRGYPRRVHAELRRLRAPERSRVALGEGSAGNAVLR